MYRIFIVEDDPTMANAMKEKIESWGNEARIVEHFQNVMTEFTVYDPHLVLMDIMLPFFNGYHWCTQIRQISQVPVVFLSSASDNMNIVMAMNMGGDDFLAKPIDLDVMMAKITAMLRRTYDMGNQLPMLEHRGLMLGLMERKGEIVSRDTLMMRLWQMDDYVEENTLTVNVNRLRKKLDSIGLHDYIVTKVGVGYLLPLE